MNLTDWILLLLAWLAFIGQCVYIAALSRRARLEHRLVLACGGRKQAEALVERIEQQNGELLAGGLSALLFTKRNTPK